MGAKSAISKAGDKIRLLNYGTAYCGRVLSHGKPFAASYSLSDGTLIRLTVPTIDKPLTGGYYTDDGRIYWQTKKGFYTTTKETTPRT